MYYNPNLKQYSFGSWLQSNAGTIGTVAGGAIGAFGGPAGIAAGASIGGALGGAAQSNYEGGQAADQALESSERMRRLQMAQNQLQSNPGQTGVQNFQYGGKINKVSYNQFFPQTTSDSSRFYITRRTTDTMNNPSFVPFGENYSAYSDSTLVPNYGNIPGYTFDRNTNKINFNASDSQGNTELFKRAFKNEIPSSELNLPQLKQKAYGGSLNKMEEGGQLSEGQFGPSGLETYSGQTHSGPQGGIPVGANGSPTSITGEQPVGLVENNESAWTDPESGEVYIFSDKLTL